LKFFVLAQLRVFPSNPSTNVARSAGAGFWCIRRSSSHSVLLRLNACVLHDLLLEGKTLQTALTTRNAGEDHPGVMDG
jgi:hypothetical protein